MCLPASGGDGSYASIRRRVRARRVHELDVVRRLGGEGDRTLQRSPQEGREIVEVADDGDSLKVEVHRHVRGEDVFEGFEAALVEGHREGVEDLLDGDRVGCFLGGQWRERERRRELRSVGEG